MLVKYNVYKEKLIFNKELKFTATPLPFQHLPYKDLTGVTQTMVCPQSIMLEVMEIDLHLYQFLMQWCMGWIMSKTMKKLKNLIIIVQSALAR